MKPLYTLAVLLAALVCAAGRHDHAVQTATGDAYLTELVRLVTELQKNPWMGWPAGTRVVVRYVDEGGSTKAARSGERPDIVFTVVEADRSFQTTQVIKGKTLRHDFLIRDQGGLDTPWPASVDQRATPTTLNIDGVSVACLTRELSTREMPGGTTVMREWAATGHPSVVLRKETIDSNGWEVRAVTRRSIGPKDFQCVEVRNWLRFYHDGPNDSITTRYLCPGVPGHVAEQRTELYKVVKGRRSAAPFQIDHQKTMELTVPSR